jgi:hypothetical protein
MGASTEFAALPYLVADRKLVTVVISAHVHSSLRFNK